MKRRQGRTWLLIVGLCAAALFFGDNGTRNEIVQFISPGIPEQTGSSLHGEHKMSVELRIHVGHDERFGHAKILKLMV